MLDLLTALVDRSLVTYEAAVGARYRLLETVREYAAECLAAAGELEELRGRHLDYCVWLSEQAEPWLFGGVADPGWLRRIAAEMDNLRAALAWCETGSHAEPALRILGAIHWIWFHRGHLREGRERTEAALRARERVPEPVRAKALYALALIAFWQGDYGAMLAPAEESLRLVCAADDPFYRSCVLLMVGAARHFAGDAACARQALDEAISCVPAEEHPLLVPFTRWWYGLIVRLQGDLEAARVAYETGLATARAHQARPAIAHMLYPMGQIHAAQGDLAAARACYAESLRLMAEMDDRWGAALVLDGLAQAAAALGDAPECARLIGITEALREAIGAAVPAYEQPAYEERIALARVALGEETFRAAVTIGRATPLDQALTVTAVLSPS